MAVGDLIKCWRNKSEMVPIEFELAANKTKNNTWSKPLLGGKNIQIVFSEAFI